MGSTLTSHYKPTDDIELDLLPSPAKRARFDPEPCKETDENVNNCTTRAVKAKPSAFEIFLMKSPTWMWPIRGSSGPLAGPQHTKWERLPYVALVEIFRSLPHRDKCNAALACRAWFSPLQEPVLWRRGNFRFDGVSDKRALLFVSRMGSALRHVSIECADTNPPSRSTSRSTRNLATFLSTLATSGNAKLATLRLTHLSRFRKQLDTNDLDLIHLLVAAQRNLTSLDLECAGIDVDQGFSILSSVATSSGASLQALHIAEFFWPDVNREVSHDPRLFSLLASFPVLKELSISYDLLSDDLLFLLASNMTFTLTQITVVGQAMGLESRTSWRAWTRLTFKCPRLSAKFRVKGIERVSSFQMMLTPGTPLTHLQLDMPGVYTNITSSACLDHVVTNFYESLRHLELNLYLVRFHAEEEVTRLVRQCPCLESLHITSRLMDQRQELYTQRALRRVISRKPGSRLKEVTINGENVSLESTWTTALVDWLTEQI